jgi:hypothetical protein
MTDGIKIEMGVLMPSDEILCEAHGQQLLRALRGDNWHASFVYDGQTVVRPLLRVLVSERAYTRKIDPVWCPVAHVSPGDASVYPVKVTCTNGASGQFKFGECIAVAITEDGVFWNEQRGHIQTDGGSPA